MRVGGTFHQVVPRRATLVEGVGVESDVTDTWIKGVMHSA